MKRSIVKLLTLMLIACSATIMVACGTVNIESIEVIESTVPDYIVAGSFDEAEIKLLVTYSDGEDDEVIVTSEMIPEEHLSKLTTPGIYKITILYRGETADVTVRIVDDESLYTVKFYNGLGQPINTQIVVEGDDAVAPSAALSAIPGYELQGWDIAFTNITADTNVYGIYTKVEEVMTDEAIIAKLKDVAEAGFEQDLFVALHQEMNGAITGTGAMTWHYIEEGDLASVQQYSYNNNNVLTGYLDIDESGLQRDYDLDEDRNIPLTGMRYINNSKANMKGVLPGRESIAAMLEKSDTVACTAQYVKNQTIYTVTATIIDEMYPELNSQIVFRFTDTQMIDIVNVDADDPGETEKIVYTYYYETVAFIDCPVYFIGDVNMDGEIDTSDSSFIWKHFAKEDFTLTEEQQLLADVNEDDIVDYQDLWIVRSWMAEMVDCLPFNYYTLVEGDANEDGIFDDEDVELVRESNGGVGIDVVGRINADLDHDGDLDEDDVTLLEAKLQTA